jgi:hypothetical protein
VGAQSSSQREELEALVRTKQLELRDTELELDKKRV